MANIAAMYAVYHGPKGLKEIASVVHEKALLLAAALQKLGYQVSKDPFFDTVKINTTQAVRITQHLVSPHFNPSTVLEADPPPCPANKPPRRPLPPPRSSWTNGILVTTWIQC